MECTTGTTVQHVNNLDTCPLCKSHSFFNCCSVACDKGRFNARHDGVLRVLDRTSSMCVWQSHFGQSALDTYVGEFL